MKSITTAIQDVSLKMAIDTFIEIDTMGKSGKTKSWYEKRLQIFQREIGDREIISILEIDLFTWYKKLENSKLAPDTKHGYIRAVKKLFKFLFHRGIISANIAQDLRLPKLPKRSRKGITDDNAKAIIEATRKIPRDFALVQFLESTNARRAGIAGLKISDLALDAPEPLCRRAIVHEKGDIDRTVIMSQNALNAIKQWLMIRNVKSEFVFTNAKGQPLTPDGVSEVIDRYKKKLNLKGNCSPHQWRHRWCRRQIQNKMPLPQVSQLAGHKSIVVTADFYGTFAIDELQEAYDRYYKPPENQE